MTHVIVLDRNAPRLDDDQMFFAKHRDRQCHIRKARQAEYASEFVQLGDHDIERRRILCWAPPRGNPLHGHVVKLTFLAFADETIADTDEVLLPILRDIMKAAAKEHGVPFGNA